VCVCVCAYIIYIFMHDIQVNVLLHMCYVVMCHSVLQQCVVLQCNAMWYSVLQQYTAYCLGARTCIISLFLFVDLSVRVVCCSKLQNIAGRCGELQGVAGCCRVLGGIERRCRVLQCVTVCCNNTQCILRAPILAHHYCCFWIGLREQWVAVSCGMLQVL